jgi:hypothetical protein
LISFVVAMLIQSSVAGITLSGKILTNGMMV